MEKYYSLRNVRELPGSDAGITAAIYFGHRRIGEVRAGTAGSAHLEVDLFTDRIVFERYLDTWWAAMRKEGTPGGTSPSNDPSFSSSPDITIGHWMRSMLNDLAMNGRSRRAA